MCPKPTSVPCKLFFSCSTLNVRLEGTYQCHYTSPHVYLMKRTVRVKKRVNQRKLLKVNKVSTVSTTKETMRARNDDDGDEKSDACPKRPIYLTISLGLYLWMIAQ